MRCWGADAPNRSRPITSPPSPTSRHHDIGCAASTANRFTPAGKRFEAYGWDVQRISDINDLSALDGAIEAAKRETERPSLIICRTHIGFGSPNRVDTSKAHGEALGEDEIKLTKRAYGWPSAEPFFVPDEALAHMRRARERGAALQAGWNRQMLAYTTAHPAESKEMQRRLAGTLPDGWDADIPVFTKENGAVASRAASGTVLNAIAKKLPELMGGSADLAPSTLTMLKDIGTFELGATRAATCTSASASTAWGRS